MHAGGQRFDSVILHYFIFYIHYIRYNIGEFLKEAKLDKPVGGKRHNGVFIRFDSLTIDKGNLDEKAIFCIQPEVLHLILIVYQYRNQTH